MVRLAMWRGFTLIELCCALIIISLIVGGIVLGQELVSAAGIRATIGQLESYNAAVHTFRGKYGALPGDMPVSEASEFGFFALDAGLGGDGDGQIELLDADAPNRAFSGEAPVFWRHLSEASLVEGRFGSIGNSAINPTTGTLIGAVTQIDQSIPAARMGLGNYITAYSFEGVNYYELNAINRISTQGVYTVVRPALLPSEAYAIDAKVDDGNAIYGSVVASGRAGLTGALNQAADMPPVVPACVHCAGGTCALPGIIGVDYMVSSGERACALRIVMAY